MRKYIQLYFNLVKPKNSTILLICGENSHKNSHGFIGKF